MRKQLCDFFYIFDFFIYLNSDSCDISSSKVIKKVIRTINFVARQKNNIYNVFRGKLQLYNKITGK